MPGLNPACRFASCRPAWLLASGTWSLWWWMWECVEWPFSGQAVLIPGDLSLESSHWTPSSFPFEPFPPVPIPLPSAEGSQASICWTVAEHSLYALGWVRYWISQYGVPLVWSCGLRGRWWWWERDEQTVWVERGWVACFVSETLGNGLSSSLHSRFFISLHFKESYIEGSSEGGKRGWNLSQHVLWFICIFNCANRGFLSPTNLYYCPLCVVFINIIKINAYIIDLFSIKPKKKETTEI